MKIEKNKIIFFSVIGLIIIFIGTYSLLVFGDEEKESQLNQIVVPNVDASKDQYQSKLDAINAQEKKKNTHIPSVYDEIISSYDKTDTELTEEDRQRIIDSIYKSGQIDYSTETSVSSSNHIPPPNVPSYQPKTSTTTKTPEIDPEEAYRQELLKAKEEMLRHHRASQKRYQKDTKPQEVVTPKPKVVEIRASIYQDQYVLPGNRVKLVLNHDFVYHNQLFPKGTFIYAFVEMAPYRVFLEVDNIAHVSIPLVAKDITDGRIGLYSTRAGELWSEYKDEFSNDVGDDASDVAADVSNSSLVGAALKGLGNFFKKKKIRDRDKILLQNNDEVILISKPK